MELETTMLDPVCGMTVKPETAKGPVEHGGRAWYFCGPSCVAKFHAEPTKYDGSQPLVSQPPVVAAAGGYTCPMHPEVLRDKPGACPICGMALEPRTISLDEENPEL